MCYLIHITYYLLHITIEYEFYILVRSRQLLLIEILEFMSTIVIYTLK